MRVSITAAATAAITLSFASPSLAFPSFSSDAGRSPIAFVDRAPIPDPLAATRPSMDDFLASLEKRAEMQKRSPVVPAASYKYRAPKKGDQRSPCPGMNTLANHGLLPRNGVVHLQDIIFAAQEGFGMGVDFATFLAVFGVLQNGDPLTNMLSIGGPIPQILNGGKAGLNNHGHFEGDASLSRNDYYFGGQNAVLNTQRYAKFTASNKKFNSAGNATKDSLKEYRYQRFLDSKSTNPQFQFAFPRYAFSYGEAALVLNLMADARNGEPSGDSVAKADLDSFFLEERFPYRWARRATPYTFAQVGADTLEILLANFVPPGQNAGKNNYIPLEPSLKASDLTPQNLGCALYESVVSGAAPSAVQNLLDPLLNALADLGGKLYKPVQDSFNCAFVNITDPTLRSSKNFKSPNGVLASERPILQKGQGGLSAVLGSLL